jgi:hypothetical protein
MGLENRSKNILQKKTTRARESSKKGEPHVPEGALRVVRRKALHPSGNFL